MPRTKGSKNRPKTTHTDYASQITEKQESITSLTAEISSITANIDTLKADLKEKKTALKKAKKKWHPWKRRRQRQMIRPLKKLLASIMSADEILEKLKEDRPCGQTEFQKFTRFF